MRTFRSMGCDVEVAGATRADVDAVERHFAGQDARFSRFRSGSELNRVNGAAADPVLVSQPFARMLAAALAAASATSGLVTPTVGAALEAAGYDRDFDELDELQHAYAITVHRSQGSEYPAVVVPLTMSAYTLLQRNLLYTAITRAKRLVVLVGSRKALAIAVRTAGTGRRHTALTHRLQKPGNTAG